MLKHDEFNQEEDEIEDFDDLDNDEFEDFDAEKGGLGDLWANNPMMKLGVVALGIVVIVTALIIFSGGKDEIPSVVSRGKNEKEILGEQAVSQDFENRVKDSNETNLGIAQDTGNSFIPISTEQATSTPRPGEEVVEDELDDPLGQWRNKKRDEIIKEETKVEKPKPEIEPIEVQPQPVVLHPNPEMVSNLASLMAAQMEQILGQHSIQSPQHIAVVGPDFLNPPETGDGDSNGGNGNGNSGGQGGPGGGNGGDGGGDAIPQKTIAPAGTVVYAQTLTEANTDAPGPVLAQILSGPLKGSRALGSFNETDNFLVIEFDQIVYEGRSLEVDGVALDVDTTLPGVATETDRRYFKRIILPAAAAFIKGFGSAVAETGSTEVAVQGETVTTSTNDLNTREELFKGVEEATERIGEVIDEEANRTRPMIKVAAGTPIGILFADPIMMPAETPDAVNQ